MSRVARLLVSGVAVLLLAGCAGAEGPDQRGADPGAGRFVVSYEKPATKAQTSLAREVRDRGVVDETVAALNDYLILPVDVTVAVRSCDDGALYDPSKREIQVCLEDVAESRELIADAEADDTDEIDRGILVDTVNHEAGHALLDVYDMEFTGREEDVADQFSAFMSVRAGDRGLDDLESAAYGYELSAYAYEADPTDEHTSDAQRAVNYQCYVYGSDARDSQHLIAKDGLTKQRAEFCWEEWSDLLSGWLELLKRANAFRDVVVPADER